MWLPLPRRLAAWPPLQAFLRSGEAGPDGAPGEPSLERFEAEIQRYKAVQDEIQVPAWGAAAQGFMQYH